jgi:hypothetical protein
LSLLQKAIASFQLIISTGSSSEPLKWLGLFPVTALY